MIFNSEFIIPDSLYAPHIATPADSVGTLSVPGEGFERLNYMMLRISFGRADDIRPYDTGILFFGV